MQSTKYSKADGKRWAKSHFNAPYPSSSHLFSLLLIHRSQRRSSPPKLCRIQRSAAMKSPASLGRRSRRQRFFFFFCCSALPVPDPDDFDPPRKIQPARDNPAASWSRLRCHNKTVPVVEMIADCRKGTESVAIATQGNSCDGLLQKLGMKKCKATAKTFAGNPVSKLQQRSICVKSANVYLRCQPPAPLNRVHNPAQTGVGTTETSSPNAPSPALPALPETRPVETVTVLLLLTTTTLVALLFYGRVFAVLCTCFWLSLLALVCSSPVICSPGVNRVEETIDVSSPEYKKKVVLMGLLERNKPSLRRVC